MDLGLQDRVYLVTGGSRGLGYAAAEALVAEGARVVVSSRDAGAAAGAAQALGSGRAVGLAADNADPATGEVGVHRGGVDDQEPRAGAGPAERERGGQLSGVAAGSCPANWVW